MNTNMTIQVTPADNLRKLNDLLAVLGQSMRDGTSPSEEIETCIGIAWDLGNSAYNRILTQSQVNQPTTDYTPYNIGNRIQIAREKLGMSEDDLAEKLNIHPGDVLTWEDGADQPLAGMVIPLANALKCDPMWLLTGESNNANQATPVNVMKGADLANIGVRIKNRRNETGMGADKLADAIDVPIHQIYQWEEGKVIPHSGCYCRLAKALNTSMSWLMTGKDISGEFKNQHDENIPSSDLTNL
ncbi:helix-turn-helix domain-containing protein [Salmonella enterica subsp. enterica]|nr:helix-turn-helix domain-containing protein [Salmonella enterica subsp. enterica serovar Miami]EDO3656263.1 helix-turn-helix domain-containing protein [Salmonella enterica]EFP4424630.1 helix-turn-helix domain-containing protein [Salmonella enterica]EHI6831004.1 helix-turn-helix domain-containing protein [Salmonella enterica]EKO1093475.1 helix-turn-helix domain-containing protein [Salmonella enterica subsp. enterica]